MFLKWYFQLKNRYFWDSMSIYNILEIFILKYKSPYSTQTTAWSWLQAYIFPFQGSTAPKAHPLCVIKRVYCNSNTCYTLLGETDIQCHNSSCYAVVYEMKTNTSSYLMSSVFFITCSWHALRGMLECKISKKEQWTKDSYGTVD